MRTPLIALLLLGVSCSCPKPPPSGGGNGGGGGGGGTTPPPPETRTPAVPKDHPLYARVEGAGFANECTADANCFKGGCSSEVCSAQSDVVTTCEVIEKPYPPEAACGCVEKECVWYTTAGGGGGGGGGGGAAQGMKCDDGKCAEGLTCVAYYGVAGPSGPKFTSCEIPCTLPESTCPEGQKCITIADGPGRVCRPDRL